eukprot:GHVT01038501.1.p1 GENE.GHVT01038501.1~~GHVT01038501.1.p1  ORF type:complete len:103 (+),score=1.66 GHVT01038501.1:379-687(+)
MYPCSPSAGKKKDSQSHHLSSHSPSFLSSLPRISLIAFADQLVAPPTARQGLSESRVQRPPPDLLFWRVWGVYDAESQLRFGLKILGLEQPGRLASRSPRRF